MARFTFLTAAALAAPLACSSSASVATQTDGDTACDYLPREGDFYGYRQWTTYREDSGLPDSVPSPAADGGTAVVHNGGLRIEYVKYLNGPPKHGDKAFPCGTLIVKEIPAQQQVFAMAKRGGDYNAYDGGAAGPIASGWEWIEIDAPLPQDQITFLWDGLPPANQAYSGNNPYVCNECHEAMGRGNDFVASPKIRLASF